MERLRYNPESVSSDLLGENPKILRSIKGSTSGVYEAILFIIIIILIIVIKLYYIPHPRKNTREQPEPWA